MTVGPGRHTWHTRATGHLAETTANTPPLSGGGPGDGMERKDRRRPTGRAYRGQSSDRRPRERYPSDHYRITRTLSNHWGEERARDHDHKTRTSESGGDTGEGETETPGKTHKAGQTQTRTSTKRTQEPARRGEREGGGRRFRGGRTRGPPETEQTWKR